MISMVLKLASGLAWVLLATGVALAQEADAERGREVAQMCVACHQQDGSGMEIPGGESWPRLAGMDAGYLAAQMQAIRDGTRISPTMKPFADMLDERQVRDVSLYYSQLPATPGQGSAEATQAELAHGERLATEGDWDRYIVPCVRCHGPGNRGAGEHFPGIAGQHAGYIAGQLGAWQDGRRRNDPQQLMAVIAKRLDDADIRAVSQWLARQPANPEGEP